MTKFPEICFIKTNKITIGFTDFVTPINPSNILRENLPIYIMFRKQLIHIDLSDEGILYKEYIHINVIELFTEMARPPRARRQVWTLKERCEALWTAGDPSVFFSSFSLFVIGLTHL
ncbi:hypothetical protein ACJX0J_009319, partial [Zea mays]